LSIHCYVSLYIYIYIYIVLLLLYLYKVLLNGYFHKYKPEMWIKQNIKKTFPETHNHNVKLKIHIIYLIILIWQYRKHNLFHWRVTFPVCIYGSTHSIRLYINTEAIVLYIKPVGIFAFVAALRKPKGKSNLDYWNPSVPVSKKILIFQEMFHKNQGICNYEIPFDKHT
jgi:hypothetical protein